MDFRLSDLRKKKKFSKKKKRTTGFLICSPNKEGGKFCITVQFKIRD